MAIPQLQILRFVFCYAYKHEIVFGIDEADIKDYYPVKCAIKKETIRIDYIPPHSNQTFTVFFMDKFPKQI